MDTSQNPAKQQQETDPARHPTAPLSQLADDPEQPIEQPVADDAPAEKRALLQRMTSPTRSQSPPMGLLLRRLVKQRVNQTLPLNPGGLSRARTSKPTTRNRNRPNQTPPLLILPPKHHMKAHASFRQITCRTIFHVPAHAGWRFTPCATSARLGRSIRTASMRCSAPCRAKTAIR